MKNMIWFYYDLINVPMEHRDFKPVEIETSTLLDLSNFSTKSVNDIQSMHNAVRN